MDAKAIAAGNLLQVHKVGCSIRRRSLPGNAVHRTRATALRRVTAPLALSLALCGSAVGQSADLPEVDGNAIGYASPQAALTDVRSHPGVRFTNSAGVSYAFDRTRSALWGFTQVAGSEGLSAVKQQVVQDGDRILVRTSVLCDGSKQACDELVRQTLTRLKARFPSLQ